MPCDVLVLAPHPDDAELHCGATIAALVRQGRRVVIVDATAGELGSRGTVAGRAAEAAAAAATLGLSERENLGLPDGAIAADDPAQRQILVDCLRRHRPRLVLAHHPHAQHPDHVALGTLARHAAKLAAVHRYASGPALPGLRLAWYEGELPIVPSWITPATETDRETKRRALADHASQFGLDQRGGAPTRISDPAYLQWIDDRGRSWGYHAGAPYAEAFVSVEVPVIADPLHTLPGLDA